MTITVAPYADLSVLSRMKDGEAETLVAITEQLRTANIHEVPEKVKVSQEHRPGDADFEYLDIPSIDLSLIETERAELVRKFGEASRQWGICRVVNHGIPADLMKELEIHGLNFFCLSDEEKSKLVSRKTGHSYYTGNNTQEQRHSLHWAESFVLSLGQWGGLDLDVIKKATTDWHTADDEFR